MANAERLAHWNDTPSKSAIVDFVERTTTEGSADYLEPNDRIAVFDNDGTLWTEQPLYNQFLFAIDRLRVLAPDHPEWNDDPALGAVLKGDMAAFGETGMKGVVELVMATHAGLTTEAFDAVVLDWIGAAQHPVWKRPYPKTAFQPMIELLDYLRANGYSTFIVSGGGVEFMRAFTQDAYGIPPEQVIGSTGKTEFKVIDGKPVLVKLPEIDAVNDGPGKPVGIQKFLGRRPVITVGNSDGDLEMLQYTAAGDGPRFMAIVHHDDAERETAYDKGSSVGALDKALTEANARGWTVISMKNDWTQIFVD
jgi:phosphoglycolate phosphatase-like HAD superfamily hydrolase